MVLIGVLICDHVEQRHREAAGGDYDDIFARSLRAVDPDLDLRFYDAIAGEVPSSPDECDGWIITGSRHSAYEGFDWIEKLSEFIRLTHSHNSRMVGVCFGHQLIAQALGGKVERAPAWTAGVQHLEVEPQDWFSGGSVGLLAMHQDVVTQLPVDSQVIASGTTAKVPAFLVGDTMLGIQYHPEFNRSFEEALIAERIDIIGKERSTAAIKSLDCDIHNEKMTAWMLAFLADERPSNSSDLS